MREETNFVVLSSNERTNAPSVLLLTISNKPGKPVTATILLYSIIKIWEVQDTTTSLNALNAEKKF